MWHEARKREKATQKLFNDHKKRSEKRRGENRIDPNSLLQVHGLRAKLCLDPSVYKQALKSLVVWQGDKSVTIDRFDVRATLDSIPSDPPPSQQGSSQQTDKNKSGSRGQTILDADESESMKKILNYERYRLLIKSDLDKMPEELRLKLVSNCDVSSDAKMRKLRNNKFGTSGEASVSTSQTYHMNIQKASHFKSSDKRGGATIGYNYSSVPPPACLGDTLRDEDTVQQNHAVATTSESGRASYMDIIDMEEYDNFDLESVDVSCIDTKLGDEIARKYNLAREELILLSKKDSQETSGASEILKELDKLKTKLVSSKADPTSRISKHDSQVYGPALPPDLIASANRATDSPNSSSTSSPVGQRSPSGMAGIPLRNGHLSESPESPSAGSPKEKSPSPQSDLIVPLNINNQNDAPPIKQSENIKPSSFNRQGRSENEVGLESTGKSVDLTPDQMSPRRAATPLAYKKYRRSSRSLSRERRSMRHRSSNRKRRRRHRHNSRSTSSSSLSSCSSGSSRRASRRRRRSRSRRESHR